MDKGEEEDSTSSTQQHSEDAGQAPDCYILPPLQRPNLQPEMISAPVIDMSDLRGSRRAIVVEETGRACREMGFFQVINHEICESVLEGALSAGRDFFALPMEEKVGLMSDDVTKPVRFSTSIRDGMERSQYRRVFLKHYAHPLDEWAKLWPSNPPDYRIKMGRYCSEASKLAVELLEAITESLGLGPTYLIDKLREGTQTMAINCYPACPHPDLVLGLPPHHDFSCITILLQNCPGLQVISPGRSNSWQAISKLPGSLHVHVGDHLEVLSNGRYKSLLHRSILNKETTRISIASLHALGMDDKMSPADALVDDRWPRRYKESSFRDFLSFIAKSDSADGGSYIDSLKMDN